LVHHKPKANKTEYEKLRDVWYAKLAKSGFVDAEQDEEYLKQGSSARAYLQRPTWRHQVEYYQMATDMLNTYKFASKVEQVIWEYHANGISTRDIATTLNKVRKKKILRMTVWRIVRRLEIEMKKLYVVGFRE
jgi:hypothetical protein